MVGAQYADDYLEIEKLIRVAITPDDGCLIDIKCQKLIQNINRIVPAYMRVPMLSVGEEIFYTRLKYIAFMTLLLIVIALIYFE